MNYFSEKITEHYNQLTYQQRIAANYFLEHNDTIAFSTLDELSQKVGVSTTTVLRFIRLLGYQGYTDFQKSVQSQLLEKKGLPERFSVSLKDVSDSSPLQTAAQISIDNIVNTVDAIPKEDLQNAVEHISSAEHVYILGMRSSFALSHYMASRLGQIRPHIHPVQSVGMIFPEELVGAGKKDVCIAYLFPRYSKTAANLLSWIKKMDMEIILITGQNDTPVKSYGDIFLPCNVNGISFKNSFCAPMFLTDYIASSVATLTPERTMSTLQQTEDFLNRGYYLGL